MNREELEKMVYNAEVKHIESCESINYTNAASFKTGASFVTGILMPELERLKHESEYRKAFYNDVMTALEKEISEAKARIDELEKFFCEIAKSMSGIRIAVDYMATRNRTNSQIHPTNIDYFKKLDEKLFDLDNKIFEFGNFENGEFVFKSEMESEKK